MTQENNTQAAIDAGKEIATAQQIAKLHDGIPFLVKSDGGVVVLEALVKMADQRAPQPRELAGRATLRDEAGLIAHMLRFRDGDSALFYDGEKLLAVYDYHRPMVPPAEGQPFITRNDKARWGRHSAVFTPLLSPEWKAWVMGAGKMLGQAEFADFIDEHASDIAMPNDQRPSVPTVADLATMAMTLKVTSQDVCEATINRTTGEYHMVAKSEQQPTGQTKIPKEFDVEIPIYEGGQKYRFACAVRFRKGADNKPTFGWVVRGADKLLRDAFAEMAARVSDKTGVPAFAGSPETAQ